MKLQYLAFDTEATGLDPYKGVKVFSFSTCNVLGESHVYRLDGKKASENKQWLKTILADSSIVKICHNYHFDMAILQENGYYINPETIWEDTMLMSQLFDNIAAGHGLDEVAFRYCKDTEALREWMEVDKEINMARKIYGTYDKIPEPLMTRYQIADSERTMLIFQTLKEHIHGNPEIIADYQNEIELVKTTVAFEKRGITLCKQESKRLLDWLQEELKKVETDSFRLLGQYVNFNSADQVISILYEHLKLPVLFRTKGGKPSTDKDTLEELRSSASLRERDSRTLDIFDCILRQRSYTKGVSMITSYIEAAGESGIIHPHINTNKAITGREAGENPNMQNISKEAALKNRFPVPARKCFRARPKHILFLIDYAGIEMRLIVELTQEPELVELIRNNGDPHALAASLFYGSIFTDRKTCLDFISNVDKKFQHEYRQEIKKAPGAKEREEINERYYKKAKKILRTAAKNSQFALAYGGQLPRIADTLMLSPAVAAPGYRAYCSRFPLVAGFTNRMKKEIQSSGYVKTPFGRHLKTNPAKPYSASNYMIQGTAAGILKRAQVRVHKYLQKEYGGEIALVLPIHDELIIEMPRRYLPKAKKILSDIRKLMIDMSEIKIPLDVETKMTAYTWNEAKEYKV